MPPAAPASGLLPRLGVSEGAIWKNFLEWRRNAAELCRDPNQQALIALSLASPMRGACYMTVLPLHLADTLAAGPADIGMVSPPQETARPAFSPPRGRVLCLGWNRSCVYTSAYVCLNNSACLCVYVFVSWRT